MEGLLAFTAALKGHFHYSLSIFYEIIDSNTAVHEVWFLINLTYAAYDLPFVALELSTDYDQSKEKDDYQQPESFL